MTRIYDKNFKYVPSFETNVKQTFARIRRQLQQAVDAEDVVLKNKSPVNVVTLAGAKRERKAE